MKTYEKHFNRLGDFPCTLTVMHFITILIVKEQKNNLLHTCSIFLSRFNAFADANLVPCRINNQIFDGLHSAMQSMMFFISEMRLSSKSNVNTYVSLHNLSCCRVFFPIDMWFLLRID